MRRHLGTLLLVLLAVGLAAWLWRDRDRLSTTERKGREYSVFPAWRRDDLTRLEIAHEDETIVLERANKDAPWRMKSPRDERVDQGAAERLTTTMEFAVRVRPVASSDQLGFEHPRASGSVAMGSMTFRFVMGAPSPRPEGSSYVKVDDGAPFVCSKEVAEALLAGSDTYRDRSVVPYLSLELARFEVAHARGGFTVERLDARSFKVAPDGLLASRRSLDRAWSALAEMRAEAFPKDADADRLTAKPQMTIRMAPKDPAKGLAELVVGEACPGHPDDVVVLRQKPTRAAACAPKGAIEALRELTGEMLVDRAPLGFRHDEVEELRLEGGDAKPIELARRGVGFHEREPLDRELEAPEADAVRELLVALEKTEASDVKPGHGAPFDAKARAKVWAGDHEHEEVVEVGAAEKGRVVVRRVRDDARLTLSPVAARRLTPRETTLRPLAMSTETRRVTRVALRCGTEQDLEDRGDGLRLVKPAGYETDGHSVTQLVDALLRGKVTEWTADRDDGSFGITEDGCRVTLSFADGNTPRVVRLGGKTDGGVFGTIDGERGVFVAPPLVDALVRGVYVSRASLRAVDAEKVTARLHGRPVAASAAGMESFFAEGVRALGSSDVGPVDLELLVSIADAGPPRRIVCSASAGGLRRCAAPDLSAVFDVKDATVAQVVGPQISDAGAADAR